MWSWAELSALAYFQHLVHLWVSTFTTLPEGELLQLRLRWQLALGRSIYISLEAVRAMSVSSRACGPHPHGLSGRWTVSDMDSLLWISPPLFPCNCLSVIQKDRSHCIFIHEYHVLCSYTHPVTLCVYPTSHSSPSLFQIAFPFSCHMYVYGIFVCV